MDANLLVLVVGIVIGLALIALAKLFNRVRTAISKARKRSTVVTIGNRVYRLKGIRALIIKRVVAGLESETASRKQADVYSEDDLQALLELSVRLGMVEGGKIAQRSRVVVDVDGVSYLAYQDRPDAVTHTVGFDWSGEKVKFEYRPLVAAKFNPQALQGAQPQTQQPVLPPTSTAPDLPEFFDPNMGN